MAIQRARRWSQSRSSNYDPPTQRRASMMAPNSSVLLIDSRLAVEGPAQPSEARRKSRAPSVLSGTPLIACRRIVLTSLMLHG